MPAVTTDGLILKRKDFGEADRVLTVLTNRYGKISVIAKGVRKITSRRAGNIEVLNLVKLHLFKAKSYTLSEAESIATFQKLKDNLTLSTTAFHIIELIDRLVPEEQKNERLFDLTIAVLKILEQNPRQIFVRSFEVKLLGLLGFWGHNAVRDLDHETAYLLDQLEKESWQEIGKIELKEEQAISLEKTLRYYIERILESGLKSAKVMEKLKS
jgi:hypothetical protein